MKKKIFTLLLAVVASYGMINAEVISGTCGQNLTWSLNTMDSTLTIQGTGSMQDYNTSSNPAPWSTYPSYIKYAIIMDGITHIGDDAFSLCWNLESLTLEPETPPTINNIGLTFGMSMIYVPCGTLETYRNAEGWSEYAGGVGSRPWTMIEEVRSPYTLTIMYKWNYAINPEVENAVGTGYTYLDPDTTVSYWKSSACNPIVSVNVKCTLELAYKFAKWADGNTDNPRLIEITHDTLLEPILEYILVGKCGDGHMLTWTLDTTNMALTISGVGALTKNYTYCYDMESVIIGNGVTSIGEEAFYDFGPKMKNVVIGSSVGSIGRRAFYNSCGAIKTITCYSQYPPSIEEDAFDADMPTSTIIYVPADYVSTYKAHDFWGKYDVRPLENHEAIEEIEGNSVNSINKFLRNGQILIIRGDKTYTLQGQEVK